MIESFMSHSLVSHAQLMLGVIMSKIFHSINFIINPKSNNNNNHNKFVSDNPRGQELVLPKAELLQLNLIHLFA